MVKKDPKAAVKKERIQLFIIFISALLAAFILAALFSRLLG